MLWFWSKKRLKIRLKNAQFLPWFLEENIDDIGVLRFFIDIYPKNEHTCYCQEIIKMIKRQ
jgi:hypothetical protein